jgi:ribosomal protein S3
LSYFVSKRLAYDLRNIYTFNKYHFNNVITFFEHRRFAFITSRVIAEYIVRRFRLHYSISKIVYPLLKEAKRDKKFKGFYLKFKGRLNRKPRVVVNKRIYKIGKIGFSTITANVDYVFHRFETRFGTCSIKIWICRY